MSNTTKGSEKDPAANHPTTKVEPKPRDTEFFEWLERAFYGVGDYPERLEVRIIYGRNHEKGGPIIKTLVFAPPKATEAEKKAGVGNSRPSREDLVALSNEILFLCQQDVNVGKTTRAYGVRLWHFRLGPEPYARYSLRMTPQGATDSNEAPTDEESDGTFGSPQGMMKAYGEQFLGHHERMFGLYAGGIESTFDQQARLIAQQGKALEEARASLARQQEITERALSLEAEREAAREWRRVGIRATEKGLDLAMGLAPGILGQVLGNKQLAATADTPESLTLKAFFRKESEGGTLTDKQIDAAFGTWDDGKVISPGVLTQLQSVILLEVSEKKRPADALDELLQGGSAEITGEQAMQLQQIFSMEQLAPLLLLIQTRMAKKEAAKASLETSKETKTP